MRAAISKAEIESEISSRFTSAFKTHEKTPGEFISTGLRQIDSLTIGGLPRGAIAEVFGPSSSGRTSLMLSVLAHATEHQEFCALVDTSNAFDPESASHAEVNLDRLLWIQCTNNLEHAFKATDLLMHGGGFGLVILDLGDVAGKNAKRIISSWWYRFRRTLEATPTALVVIAEESCVRSCAALSLELKKETAWWSQATDVGHAFLPVTGSIKTGSVILASIQDQKGKNACSTFETKVSPDDVRPFLISAALARDLQQEWLPHSTLLRALRFQVDCQRPMYIQNREEVLVRAL